MVDKRNILLIGRKDIIKRADFGDGFCDIKRPDDNNDIEWQIINAVEFGDNELSEARIADDISKTCHNIKERLFQIIFVFSEKLNEKEERIYKTIKKRIFLDDDVAKYTAIVRVVFNTNKSPEDEKKSICERVGASKIIYLNFPSLRNAQEGEEITYRNIREESRKTLIKLLKECEKEPPKQPYGPSRCLELINKIFEDWLKNNELNKKIKEKKEKGRRMFKGDKKLKKNLEEIEKELEKVKTSGNEEDLRNAEKKLKEVKEEIENSSLKAVIEIKDISK